MTPTQIQEIKNKLASLIATRKEAATILLKERLNGRSTHNPTLPEIQIEQTTTDRFWKTITYNEKQNQFISIASSGKSIVLIGAAGTGKTTCQKGLVQTLISEGRAGILSNQGHKHLRDGSPGIVICACTRRAVNNIRNTPIKNGGAKFLDKSDLYALEGQLNLSRLFHYDQTLEIILGASYTQWVMNSKGTIFADTAGAIKINEKGFYFQAKKRLFNDALTISAAFRSDKQTNFKSQPTPRITAVIKVAKDNNIRVSYQTAYRFPTNQDQYISLVTGAGTLIGSLPSFQDYYKLKTTLPGYTPQRILAYRASGNPINTNALVRGTYQPLRPETMRSVELGYKGLIRKGILIDAYVYMSKYKDFIVRYALGQSKTGDPTELFSPFTTTNISFQQNAKQIVKTWGWGFGVDHQLPANFSLYGNIFSDKIRNVPAGFVSFFNAPEIRWNIGLRNDNVYKNFGMNVVVKWQDNNYYEGTFVTGTLPYFAWVDAQVSYRPPHTKGVIRIGGTNLGNKYYRTGFGSPAVGGLYYVSYGYNIF